MNLTWVSKSIFTRTKVLLSRHGTDKVISTFELKSDVILDEVRAGGRIPLIIGRGLTDKARTSLGLGRN